MRGGYRVVVVALALLLSACNLATGREARDETLRQTQVIPPPTPIPDTNENPEPIPATRTPLMLTPVGPVRPTSGPVPTIDPNAPCRMMRVYAGTDPGNTLRLRAEPTNSSDIVILIPNHSTVLIVPSSQEVNAGGYQWVNIIYTDPNNVNHVGWAARNANRAFATLTDAGECQR